MKQRKGPEGFTLTELLVVVAIMGLLMGILIPVISKVKLQAQIATTRTLLNGVVTALESYHGEHYKYPEDGDTNWNATPPNIPPDPAPAESFVYWLYNGKTVLLSVKDNQLTTIIKTNPAIMVKDIWGFPLKYVVAPGRRDHPNYRNFPKGVGKFNLWSVGPNGIDNSSDGVPPLPTGLFGDMGEDATDMGDDVWP